MDKFQLTNGLEVKRHFYNGEHYFIDKEKKLVKLTPQFHAQLLNKKLWGRFGFKKIGGSTIGDITGSNGFSTKFIASVNFMRLGMPIFDTKYIDAGKAVEPKVVKAMEAKLKTTLEVYPAEEFNYDYFQEHEHIGGLPDASLKEEGKVYELKTTGAKNMDKWASHGVPQYYKEQVCMYHHLMFGKTSKHNPKIVACFLEPGDYANPEEVDITKRTIKSYEIEYDFDKTEEMIFGAVDFRKKVMQYGVSWPYDESKMKDKETLEWLECSNAGEVKKYLESKGLL